mgnify:FL=1
MNKDSFFDTNVIIYYANFREETQGEIMRKCYRYINEKIGRFILCHFVEQELKTRIEKRKIINKEVIEKNKNKDYDIGTSQLGKELGKNDIGYAKKLYEAHKEKNAKEMSNLLAKEQLLFEEIIDNFLKTKIDEKVIPIEQINIELVSIIRDIIENYADCQILASALQHQNKQKVTFLFVTADKKDLNPNNYDYLKDYGILKQYKFPELLNLAFSE